MANAQQPYNASTRFTNVQGILPNHFTFVIDALPDLTFFVQQVNIPSVTAEPIQRPTPLSFVQEAPSKVRWGNLTMTYGIDAGFQTYYSLYWWMMGFSAAHTNQEVSSFRAQRMAALQTTSRNVQRLEKTTATLTIRQPDTEGPVVEFHFQGLFPMTLGEITFTTQPDPVQPYIQSTVTFAYTDFEVIFP